MRSWVRLMCAKNEETGVKVLECLRGPWSGHDVGGVRRGMSVRTREQRRFAGISLPRVTRRSWKISRKSRYVRGSGIWFYGGKFEGLALQLVSWADTEMSVCGRELCRVFGKPGVALLPRS